MGGTSIYGCPVHGRLFVHERGWGIPGVGFGGGMGTLPRSCRKERVMNGAPMIGPPATRNVWAVRLTP